MQLFGTSLGGSSNSLSVIGILAAALTLAPLAMLILSYTIAGLLVYVAIAKAERFTHWIGASGTDRRLPERAARSAA